MCLVWSKYMMNCLVDFSLINFGSFIYLLQPIQDPDPFINCELMDGRDAFLTMARERHYEFSSLRRAKFSTMAMLYELHNQGQDRFYYNCNNCKAHVETRYHCTVCDVSTHFLSFQIFCTYIFFSSAEVKSSKVHNLNSRMIYRIAFVRKCQRQVETEH